MLFEQITSDIKDAMRAKEAAKLLILRTLKGEIQRVTDNPTDVEVISIIKKNVGKVKETTNDAVEIEVLNGYLPVELSTEDLGGMVYEFITENKLKGMQNMGTVMNHFKENYTGQYDGKALSDIVKRSLGA